MAEAPVRERRDFASELKFLLPPGQAEQVQGWAARHLDADPHGGGERSDAYRVTSVYFDTPTLDVYRGRASFGRSKFRVRRYNDESRAFLERKTKTRTWVSKRRSPLPLVLLPRLGEPMADDRAWPGFWFHRRLLHRALAPVCRIQYLRTARVGRADGHPVRLTLDRELRATPLDCISYEGGTPVLLPAAGWILELKFQHALPALFKRLLAELAPVPQRLSKYRLAVSALGLADDRHRQVATACTFSADAVDA